MIDKNVGHELKCFGSATVGSKGQVVIPASARKELSVDTGATLLAFIGPGKRGLFLLKANAVEEMIAVMNEQLTFLEKSLKDNNSPKSASGKKKE